MFNRKTKKALNSFEFKAFRGSERITSGDPIKGVIQTAKSFGLRPQFSFYKVSEKYFLAAL
jgi:hypothetical protein